MRFIIYGAGGIGGVVGGHLARTGHDVTLIGRPGHVRAINERGLRLVTPNGVYTLPIPAVTSPAQAGIRADDIVFYCMKGQDMAEAVRSLKMLIKDVPVFCFQNGVRNEEVASQYFPRVYGVMVRIGAVYLTDGEVIARRDPPGWLVIGRYPQGTDELADSVAESLCAAGFLVRVSSDVMPYKWGKLMGNLANAVGAITNARGDDIAQIVRAAQNEFQEIMAEVGISWVSQGELAGGWPEVDAPPRGSLNTEAQSSTWQSLARKQGNVETEFLNGEVVRLAEKIGRQAPVNEMLLRISQEMAGSHELPGKYTPAELSSLLGLDHT